MSQSECYRECAKLASEIESLEGLHKDVESYKSKGSVGIHASISHHRTHGLSVRLPKATALRVLSAEIVRKRTKLAEVKKGLK